MGDYKQKYYRLVPFSLKGNFLGSSSCASFYTIDDVPKLLLQKNKNNVINATRLK
jgi:hypothetical protein